MVRRTCTSLLFASLLSAEALACADDEATLFACQTQDGKHAIQLCGVRDDAAGGYQSLRYIYGTEETDELVYPEDRREGPAQMFFAHHLAKNGYNWTLRFDNGGYRYKVFFAAQPEDGDPDTIVGPDAGVEVWRRKKKIATVMCGERPAAYADDIRRASSCDMENSFGKAGCSVSPPTAK